MADRCLSHQEVAELENKLRQDEELINQLRLELRDARKQLSEAKEKLAVSEQVTTATQQRALLQEEGVYEKLIAGNPEKHVYEKLRKDFDQLSAKRGNKHLVTLSNYVLLFVCKVIS